MSPDTFAEALERLGAEDPEAARLATPVVGFFGESFDRINQQVVECFVWSKLPSEAPPERWLPTVAALARLLELGGLDRYARICRSRQTLGILVSWCLHPLAGELAFRRAQRRSPVWPAPIPELRAWSSPPGPLELAAYVHAGTDVELALASGTKRKHVPTVVRHSLTRPREEIGGRTTLDAAFAERIHRWRSTAARSLLLEKVPVDEPVVAPDLSALLPLQHLLHEAIDGIKLRRDGQIHRRDVQRLGYEGHEEDDDTNLWFRNGVLQMLFAVRRFGRRQVITRIGLELLGTPEMLWRLVARRLWLRPTVTCAVAEYALAVLVVDGPRADLASGVAPLLASDGWRDGDRCLTVDDVAVLVRRFRLIADALGLLDSDCALNAFGHATALEALRARATAPR